MLTHITLAQFRDKAQLAIFALSVMLKDITAKESQNVKENCSKKLCNFIHQIYADKVINFDGLYELFLIDCGYPHGCTSNARS